MWSSPFLKGLCVALLSLPFLLTPFLPPSPADIPDLTRSAKPLPRNPAVVTRSGSDSFWLSYTEFAFRDDTKRGVHLNVWNWRTGKITSLLGYTPPANFIGSYVWLTPSPDRSHLLCMGREFLPNKTVRQWLYRLNLRMNPREPGFLQAVLVGNGQQPKWFFDSRRYIYNHVIWFDRNSVSQLRIQVHDLALPGKVTEVPLRETYFQKEARIALGVTPDDVAIHFVGSGNRDDGEGCIVHTPLENTARPVKVFPVTPPHGMATIRFEPIYNTPLRRNKKGKDLLLWSEMRVANPLDRVGHQINFLSSNVRLRWGRYPQPEYYFVLWVSEADGTNFRPIGKTPSGTNISHEQWLPGKDQVAFRLYKYDFRGRVAERFYFCSIE